MSYILRRRAVPGEPSLIEFLNIGNRSMKIPNVAIFLMKSLSSCYIQPFQLPPGQHWHRQANVNLPDTDELCSDRSTHMQWSKEIQSPLQNHCHQVKILEFLKSETNTSLWKQERPIQHTSTVEDQRRSHRHHVIKWYRLFTTVSNQFWTKHHIINTWQTITGFLSKSLAFFHGFYCANRAVPESFQEGPMLCSSQ